MERVAALVVAVVMVVAALVIRARIDESDDSDGTAQLVCAEELRAACLQLDDAEGGLEVTIEPAGITAARLGAVPDDRIGDPGLDGWLVPEPWPGIVASTRQRAQLLPVLAPDADVVARSPLVIGMRVDREDALLGSECQGGVAWPCLGNVAGEPWNDVGGLPGWGRVRVAHTDPNMSATGLLVLAQATSEFFAPDAFDLFQLENSDEYIAWLTALENSAPSSAPSFERMLQTAGAELDAVGTTEADAGPLLAEARPDLRNAFTLLYPEPVATAEVVLALVASNDRDGDVEALATSETALGALAGHGWRVSGEPLARGLDRTIRLQDETNLPDEPGVYEALQVVWGRVV